MDSPFSEIWRQCFWAVWSAGGMGWPEDGTDSPSAQDSSGQAATWGWARAPLLLVSRMAPGLPSCSSIPETYIPECYCILAWCVCFYLCKIAVLLTIQVTCFIYYNFENKNCKKKIPMIVLWLEILLPRCLHLPFPCQFEGLFDSLLPDGL